MAKNRTKTTIEKPSMTLDQAITKHGELAAVNAQIKQQEGKMEVKLTKVREEFAQQLAELSARRESLHNELQHFALENPDLFAKKKSYETQHGVFGFRTGNKALKTLKGFTWASVLNLLKDKAEGYIRTKEEVNKEALLSDSEKLGDKLAGFGLHVVQEEAFFVETKEESAPATQAA